MVAPRLSPEHAWLNSTYKNYLNTNYMNHTIFLGINQSGKSYLSNWLMERLVSAGTHKFFLLNCYQQEFLEEALTFLYPNTDEKDLEKLARLNNRFTKKIRYQPIKLKIYSPLMQDTPDSLPEIFQPFTIPANDLNEEIMQSLYGDKDISRIFPIYDSDIKRAEKSSSVSYPQIKNILRKIKRSSYYEETGFMGLKLSRFDTKMAYKTIGGFLNRLQKFNKYGIISSAKNKYNLKDNLRKELRDQKTICVLDLSKIESRDIQIFCMVYFVKCLEDLIEKEGIGYEIPYKICPVFEESSEIFRRKGEGRKQIAQATIDMGTRMLTYGRHKRMEMWVLCQTPRYIEEALFSNFKTRIITFFKDPKDIEWVGQHFKALSDRWVIPTLFESLENQMRQGKYKFLILEETIDKQAFMKSTAKWGYSLPFPRTTFFSHRINAGGKETIIHKVPAYDNHAFLKKEGMPFKSTKEAKNLLMQEWKEGETQITDERKKEKEQRKKHRETRLTDKQSKDRKDATRIAKLKELGHGKSAISAMTGYSKTRITRLLGIAEQAGDEESEPIPNTTPAPPQPEPSTPTTINQTKSPNPIALIASALSPPIQETTPTQNARTQNQQTSSE